MYNLLIVDDEAETREALSSYFPWDEVGFEVVGQANNGQEALQFIAGVERVDVVLTDIKMPVMSGVELAEKLYNGHRHIKTVFISGYRDFEYAQKALHYRVKNYVLKPAKYHVLMEVFHEIKEELDAERARLKPGPHAAWPDTARTGTTGAVAAGANAGSGTAGAGTGAGSGAAASGAAGSSTAGTGAAGTSAAGTGAAGSGTAGTGAAGLNAGQPRGDESLIIHKIKSYVKENYKDASLEEVARIVHMNANYLSFFFKQKTGQNFSDYLIRTKMEVALHLLQDVSYKTYEVSEMVGYSNAKNFTRTFKSYYGKTPSEYRNGPVAP
ncbi:response regulator transcription factor [Paenibacillus ihumii]|uniref:response regulator transcription factor n=1 Tax=Paenibacillus ihumii TaxID=687436 RepID=UPI0006D857AC|nr:response regulator [Paenibacillus ihumii]